MAGGRRGSYTSYGPIGVVGQWARFELVTFNLCSYLQLAPSHDIRCELSKLIGGGQLITFLAPLQSTHVLLDFAIIQFLASRNLHSAGTLFPNRVVNFINLVSTFCLMHLVHFSITKRLGSIIEIP